MALAAEGTGSTSSPIACRLGTQGYVISWAGIPTSTDVIEVCRVRIDQEPGRDAPP
jgi:hypothetical protein